MNNEKLTPVEGGKHHEARYGQPALRVNRELIEGNLPNLFDEPTPQERFTVLQRFKRMLGIGRDL